VTTYRTRHLRRTHLREHLVDAGIGIAIGAPIAVLCWLSTLWILAR
jgi:hypothetical protein